VQSPPRCYGSRSVARVLRSPLSAPQRQWQSRTGQSSMDRL
jgi:hypothetical protein